MFLETLPPTQRIHFLRDLRSTQAVVRRGHVSNSRTSTLYQHWVSFCSDLSLDHRLQDSQVPAIELLQVYGHRIRHGHYSRLESVRADSVATAWRIVAEAHLLEDHPDPPQVPRVLLQRS